MMIIGQANADEFIGDYAQFGLYFASHFLEEGTAITPYFWESGVCEGDRWFANYITNLRIYLEEIV